jgi:hypothetical protein
MLRFFNEQNVVSLLKKIPGLPFLQMVIIKVGNQEVEKK